MNNGDGAGIVAAGAFFVVYLAVIIVSVVGIWKVFVKAGQPGVAAIVPIWNIWVLVTGVAKKEPLWFVLMLIPFVNIVISIMVILEVAKKFGKSGGYAAGLIFLPFIFWPMLGFGGSVYEGGGRRRRQLRDEYEDDEEEEERPRRRARREEEDEDDRPRRRRPSRDDD